MFEEKHQRKCEHCGALFEVAGNASTQGQFAYTCPDCRLRLEEQRKAARKKRGPKPGIRHLRVMKTADLKTVDLARAAGLSGLWPVISSARAGRNERQSNITRALYGDRKKEG